MTQLSHDTVAISRKKCYSMLIRLCANRLTNESKTIFVEFYIMKSTTESLDATYPIFDVYVPSSRMDRCIESTVLWNGYNARLHASVEILEITRRISNVRAALKFANHSCNLLVSSLKLIILENITCESELSLLFYTTLYWLIYCPRITKKSILACLDFTPLQPCCGPFMTSLFLRRFTGNRTLW